MSRITLEQANAVVAGAFAEAKALSLSPLGVVVLDAGGHIISYQRQDGASTGRLQLAMGKAAGALFFGISSRKVGDIASDRPTFISSLAGVAPAGVIPAAGGIIVVDEDGCAIGAVGISGDLSDKDEACTFAGIAAAGLTAQG
jgi:uncharacterized protein GlcG (DUF336 family)